MTAGVEEASLLRRARFRLQQTGVAPAFSTSRKYSGVRRGTRRGAEPPAPVSSGVPLPARMPVWAGAGPIPGPPIPGPPIPALTVM